MRTQRKICCGLILCTVIFFISSCKKNPNPPDPPAQTKVFYQWTNFVMGADLSYVNAVQDHGALFKDSGLVKDPFTIFKQNGANVVRVRLWHNPLWQQALNNGKIYSNLADVEKTIQRAKSAAMAVCLDLHYSDRWTDPGNQQTPAAWSGISFNALRDSVYQYTMNVLNYFKARNLTPELIQIGNETNLGILFPSGKVENNNWTPFLELLNSGIKAVRDFSATSQIKPQVILHVAGLANADWWAGNIMQAGGISDFDILGISHYYIWSTISSMNEISGMIRSLKTKYNKKIMVVETAYPWTSQNADSYGNIFAGSTGFNGYSVSKEEQYRYLKDLTQQIITGGGLGIMYWEPAWISSSFKDPWGTGSSWENNAFFDFSGNKLQAMDFMTHPYQF